MSLIHKTKKNLSWMVSLYKKVTRTTPSRTGAIIVLTTLANISLILAYFLPLKTLILMNSETILSPLTSLIKGLEKDHYIAGLSLATVIFYALHHLSMRTASTLTRQGAMSLVKRANKITVFERQDVFATSVYQKFCNVLASLLFFMVGSALGLLFTPTLFIFFIVTNLTYLALSIAMTVATSQAHRSKKISVMINAYSNICFFALFSLVIVSYFTGSALDTFSSIIGLLLARQILQRTTTLLHDCSFLLGNRAKINSLFYTSLHIHAPQETNFWKHAHKHTRHQWISNSLIELTDTPIQFVTSEYLQLGSPNIIGFDICTYDKNNTLIAEYSVKLFSRGNEYSCRHEASLLTQQWARKLPSPRLIGVVETAGFFALFFDKTNTEKPSPERAKLTWYIALSTLWTIEPSATIVDQFSRSKSMLPERLNEALGKRIISVITSAQHVSLARRLCDHLPSIKKLISELPLCIVNPDMHMATVVEREDKTPFTYNWTRWSVEPIGANWPIGKQDIAVLGKYIEDARKLRPELITVSIETLALTAIMYALESQFSRHNYLSAIELIPDALFYLEQHTQRLFTDARPA